MRKRLAAVEFVERLFGDLPDLLGGEEELRELLSHPETRRALMDGLLEKGYTKQQLGGGSRLIDAERAGLFRVLAYSAFATPPVTREQRVADR